MPPAARPPKRGINSDFCFLNIPYDKKFEKLYLAYIVALIAHGLKPRATLGVPRDARRLERIFELLRQSQYSVHDLSRIELDRRPPRAPRFNMPFELGMAVAWSLMNPQRHAWIGCDSVLHRPLKSISDLNGTDFHTHHGRIEGVMRSLCNAFVSRAERPSVPRMMRVYRQLRRAIPDLQRETGTTDLFEARIFNELIAEARVLWEQQP
ncbi:MAG: hypothetical protein ACRD3E_05400 [Terriglobales bacterium]